LTDAANGTFDVLGQADQYARARTAPGRHGRIGAFTGAYAAFKEPAGRGVQLDRGRQRPHSSEAADYPDPVRSNSSGDAGDVGRRMTALAVDGTTLNAGRRRRRSLEGGRHRRLALPDG
jgi:hypothetical protein